MPAHDPELFADFFQSIGRVKPERNNERPMPKGATVLYSSTDEALVRALMGYGMVNYAWDSNVYLCEDEEEGKWILWCNGMHYKHLEQVSALRDDFLAGYRWARLPLMRDAQAQQMAKELAWKREVEKALDYWVGLHFERDNTDDAKEAPFLVRHVYADTHAVFHYLYFSIPKNPRFAGFYKKLLKREMSDEDWPAYRSAVRDGIYLRGKRVFSTGLKLDDYIVRLRMWVKYTPDDPANEVYAALIKLFERTIR